MFDKITRIIGIGFALFWMIFTFLEYWQYHEEARRAIDYFQYHELILMIISIGAILVFLFHRFSKKKWMSFLSSGAGLALVCFLLALVCINGFFHKNLGAFLSLSENFTFIGTLLGVALSVYFIVLIAYANGRKVYLFFSPKDKTASSELIFIAIGILLIVAFLFLVGIFGGLFNFILWPVFLFTLFISWQPAWHFIQITLLKPITLLKELNVFGLSVLYLLILLIIMNFIQVARPFPIGFDAMTHYVNISSLISDYHSLVQGHGTYNWSLFMSLGLLLFGKMSITLSLSFLGSILSLFALFHLSRNWLDRNYSLLVLFLFYSIPMVSWLSYRDMKVDMGLLFYALLIVILLVDWLRPAAPQEKVTKVAKAKRKEATKKAKTPQLSFSEKLRKALDPYIPLLIKENQHITLIGILAGFALGIKLSALIIILAIIPAIAYAKGNRLTFAAATSIVLSLLLIGRLDSQAALRPLHLWADQLQWILLLIGLGFCLYLFLKQKAVLLRTLRLSILCVILSGIFLSPWLIKNIIETKSFSVSSITTGKNSSPRPGVFEIKRIYQNQQNGN